MSAKSSRQRTAAERPQPRQPKPEAKAERRAERAAAEAADALHIADRFDLAARLLAAWHPKPADADKLNTASDVLKAERERYEAHGTAAAFAAADPLSRLADDERAELCRRLAVALAMYDEADAIRGGDYRAAAAVQAVAADKLSADELAAYAFAVWAMSGERHAYASDSGTRNVPNLTKAARDDKLSGVAVRERSELEVEPPPALAAAEPIRLPDSIEVANFARPTLPYSLPLPAAEAALWIHEAEAMLRRYWAGYGFDAQRSKGVAMPHRFLMALLLQLAAKARAERTTRLVVPASEVLRWAYPDGHGQLRRDWANVSRGLWLAGALWIGGGDGFAHRLIDIPRIPDSAEAWRTGSVEIGVSLPSLKDTASLKGGRVQYEQLARYGHSDGAAYRAYLSAQAVLDRTARRGHPTKRSASSRQVGRVPSFDSDELAALAGLDSRRHNEYRRRAIAAFETLAHDGLIDLEHDTTADVWRLFGPPDDSGKR